jgi:hypothetical protein
MYKLNSFVGFIGDEQLHAQECYAGGTIPSSVQLKLLYMLGKWSSEILKFPTCSLF